MSLYKTKNGYIEMFCRNKIFGTVRFDIFRHSLKSGEIKVKGRPLAALTNCEFILICRINICAQIFIAFYSASTNSASGAFFLTLAMPFSQPAFDV